MIDETKQEILDEQEKSIIKCCLESREISFKVFEELTPDSFYHSINSRIFRTMLKIHEEADDLSFLSLKRNISRKADLDCLESIKGIDVNPKEIDGFISFIKKEYGLRSLYDIGNEVRKRAHDDGETPERLTDFIMQELLNASSKDQRNNFSLPGELLEEAIEDIKVRVEGGITGFSFSVPSLDEVTGGAKGGNFIIIAGRPQMGKTAFALQMACNIAIHDNIPVPFFSLEMSKKELMERIISSVAHVRHWKIKKGIMSDKEWKLIDESRKVIQNMKLLIEDRAGCSLGEIIAKCKRLKLKHGTMGPIFIDYLQIADIGSEGNRDQSIGRFTRGLKRLAKELDTPIICLSQLSRKCEERDNKRPILSDLRESGNLEQDSDLVLFVYREAVYNREDKNLEKDAELIVSKNRHGRTQTVYVEADLDFQSFLEKDFERLYANEL